MRFGGIERLFGKGSLGRLAKAHVAVIGLGGVGSWAVEALARSGIGELTLIDLDDVCVTNINRQVHALEATIGLSKGRALEERLSLINPEIIVHVEETFFNTTNAEAILALKFDYIIDAIDSTHDKCLLVSECRKRQLPLVVSGGVGGKSDPSQVAICDLGEATNDPLLKRVRRKLRQEYGFSHDLKEPFGIPAAFSKENPVFPWADGRVCQKPEPGSSLRLDCASGFGTASFVTGALGFAAASIVVKSLTQSLPR
ncbi:MAG: tRNA A37 threonylcarbamoyladenosine dehydratase [Verrucomicrobiales bacterium]|jgi:tRNA A37 threonylcarbamoyladenosine dehydratase